MVVIISTSLVRLTAFMAKVESYLYPILTANMLQNGPSSSRPRLLIPHDVAKSAALESAVVSQLKFAPSARSALQIPLARFIMASLAVTAKEIPRPSATSVRILPPKSTTNLPSKIISILCYPFGRKHKAQAPKDASPVRPISPRLSKKQRPERTRHQSSLISFPPPTFTGKGQPRALDTRLYPELAECQCKLDDECSISSSSTSRLATAPSQGPDTRAFKPRGSGAGIVARTRSQWGIKDVSSSGSVMKGPDTTSSPCHRAPANKESRTTDAIPADTTPMRRPSPKPEIKKTAQVDHASPLSSHPPPFWPFPEPPSYSPSLPFPYTPSPLPPLSTSPSPTSTAPSSSPPTAPIRLPPSIPTIVALRGGGSETPSHRSIAASHNASPRITTQVGPPPSMRTSAAWKKKREKARIAGENARPGRRKGGRSFWRELWCVLWYRKWKCGE